MLDRTKHEILLRQILRDLFKDTTLQGQLIFKGGTCLYLFYGLNRFSTDLDLNLRSQTLAYQEITTILKRYLVIDDFSSKKNTWFWLGSYEKGLQKIKVEVSKRNYPDEYIYKNYLGITIATLSPEHMFAHKLCAITDRKLLQNRDLFDAWFMFNEQWEPNEEIIKIRTGKTTESYFHFLIQFLEKSALRRNMLEGLGDVLDSKQKAWVKESLLEELLFQLKIRTGRN